MAGTATPIHPQTVKGLVAQILPADASTLKTLVTGATNGTKIESINVTSTDTTTRDIAIWMTISAVSYLLGTVNIPITAGNTNAIPSVDILRSLQIPSLAFDAYGNKYLYVPSGATLQVSSLSTVTAAKALQFYAQGGDF